MNMNPQMTRPVLPWWRVPTMWLVVGGPAIVVLASLSTLGIALRYGDTPLKLEPLPPRVGVAPSAAPMTPADRARNHVVSTVR